MPTLEELLEFEKYYDIFLMYKQEDNKEAMLPYLDRMGFWAETEAQNEGYVAPFREHHKSFTMVAPEAWKMGEFPIPGEYVFVKVWKDSNRGDEKSWHMQVRKFSLEEDGVCMQFGRSIYLFCFLEQTEHLRYSIKDISFNFKDNPPVSQDKDYEQRIAWEQKVAEIRQYCLNNAPELIQFTWPDHLEFTGPWEEEAWDSPQFLEKTLPLLQCSMADRLVLNNVAFKPLQWEGNKAKLTHIQKYKIQDERALREYGMDIQVDMERETGVWLHKEGDLISLNIVQYFGLGRFYEFTATMTPTEICINVYTPRKVKDREEVFNYFKQYGLKARNI